MPRDIDPDDLARFVEAVNDMAAALRNLHAFMLAMPVWGAGLRRAEAIEQFHDMPVVGHA